MLGLTIDGCLDEEDLLTIFTSGIYMCLCVEVVAKETSMTPLA